MTTPLYVYIGDIKTYWPHSSIRPLTSRQVTLKQRYLDISPDLKCGIYEAEKQVLVYKYHKIDQYDYHNLKALNNTEGFKNNITTAPIGRYIVGDHVVDVVFPITMFSDMPNFQTEYKEYIGGTYGFRSGWSWNNDISPLADIAMKFVNELPSHQRTPKYIARHLAYCMSSINRPDGLIEGLWDRQLTPNTDLNGPISPSRWRSCDSIFEQYISNGQTPVKYGQCWIFTECLTALLRFLNIPTRSLYVKNAHIDYGSDRGVDKGLDNSFRDKIVKYKGGDETCVESLDLDCDPLLHVSDDVDNEIMADKPKEWDAILGLFDAHQYHKCDDDGELIIEEYSADLQSAEYSNILESTHDIPEIDDIVNDDDSSWNFHYWNEIWVPQHSSFKECLTRKESNGLSGWYAIDSSPTEGMLTKEMPYKDLNVLGPVSVSEVKKGTPNQWDFNYFFSAVNGVVRNWKYLYIPGRNRPLAYVKSINYSYPLDILTDKPVEILTRHPLHSRTFAVVNKDLTSDYVPSNKDTALQIHYKDCPLLFSIKRGLTGRHLIVTPQISKCKGPYVVQFTFVSYTSFSVSRRWTKDLSKITLPTIPTFSTVSILIIDISSKQWWAQVL